MNNYNYLLKAVDYYISKDYSNSAKEIQKVDDSLNMNSKAFTEVYQSLSKKLSGQVAKSAYNDGMSAMDKADYPEAIKQFTKCLKSDSGNVDAMYYLTWAYSHNGDNTNAKKYFKQIADNYPDSQYYDTAKNQVGEAAE